MRFDSIIELIGLQYTQTGDVAAVIEKEPRPVFAEKQSVRRSEFYQAMTGGIRPELVFKMYAAEYQEEERLQHDGALYQVIRTYRADPKYMELVCSALDDLTVNLSKLRDTIEIWHYVSGVNELMEQTRIAQMLCIVPAYIEAKGGGSGQIAAEQTETTNTLAISIRYLAEITPDMYVLVDGQRYDIRYTEDPFNRHRILIMTVERTIP
ncbi:Phage head-tail joining protein [compost metagenome]